MGRGGRSGKEASAGKISQVDKSVWKETIGEDAYKKVVGSCDRGNRGVCTKEGEGISFVKRRKGGGEGICKGTAKEWIHLAIKITTNGAGVLCRKEGWKEEDDAGLSLS